VSDGSRIVLSPQQTAELTTALRERARGPRLTEPNSGVPVEPLPACPECGVEPQNVTMDRRRGGSTMFDFDPCGHRFVMDFDPRVGA
jgi:hypothetical protein